MFVLRKLQTFLKSLLIKDSPLSTVGQAYFIFGAGAGAGAGAFYSEPKLELLAPHYFFRDGAGALSSQKSFETGAGACGSKPVFRAGAGAGAFDIFFFRA